MGILWAPLGAIGCIGLTHIVEYMCALAGLLEIYMRLYKYCI